MQTYLVGGAVRDRLLGREPHERDWVVVGASPEQMEAAGYRQVGRDFPVFLHPETNEEYALARTERKSGHGYHGFEVHAGPEVTLEEDLGRRDLTINAIAQTPEGDIIDPYGGRADVEGLLLRHVSPAFVEDPLRVLRLARFAARFDPLGFEVADETRDLMRQMAASGELDYLVPDRVWQETERAFAEAAPARFFDELATCDALPTVFPELAPIYPGDPGGARDALTAAVDQPPIVRFAALCYPLDPDGAFTQMCERIPVPRAWADTARLTARWLPKLQKAALSDGDALWSVIKGSDALRRPERFGELLVAWDAVARGRGEQAHPQSERLRAARAAASEVDGGTLAKEGWQGAELGRELERRRRAAICEACR